MDPTYRFVIQASYKNVYTLQVLELISYDCIWKCTAEICSCIELRMRCTGACTLKDCKNCSRVSDNEMSDSDSDESEDDSDNEQN